MERPKRRRLSWKGDIREGENVTHTSGLMLDCYDKQVNFFGSCSSLIQKSRIQSLCAYNLNILSAEQMIETQFFPVVLYSGREICISVVESLAERERLRFCTAEELIAFFVEYPLVRIFHNVVAPELATRIDGVDCVAQVSVSFNGALTFSLVRRNYVFSGTAFLLKEK